MAYPHRVCIAGAAYLIRTRCINSEPMLGNNDLKNIVLQCISETMKKFSFNISSFQIEDWQITMVIQTDNDADTVSRIMQHLKSNITRRVNRRIFRTGTIWNERFSSMIIESVKDAVFMSKHFLNALLSVFKNTDKYSFGFHVFDIRKMMNLFSEKRRNE